MEPTLDSQSDLAVQSSHGVVAADHPRASQIGADILARGGTAADAAVATMLALGVVNPFASGLGGGGFCLYRDHEREDVSVLDFRETAPRAAHRDMYIVDGKAQPELARRGGLAVGVPGEAAGLWALHGRFGVLPWQDVVNPAATMARDGFEVGEMLATHISNLTDLLSTNAQVSALFQRPDGTWVQAGDTIKWTALARTLALLRDEGVAPFYSGEIAPAIVEAANAAGGIFTMEDLNGYSIDHREPVRGMYRGYEILSMPPPSSGGIVIIQVLQILEDMDLAKLGWGPQSLHFIVEALKHAFADRARWLGDADFVSVPVEELLGIEYAARLRARILDDGVLPPEAYGTAAPPSEDNPGTSHLSVIDARGNMAACTTTINTRFGAMVYVPEFGLLLNNEMADFNIEPGTPNMYGLMGTEQNAVQPGKRPLSSMSPTLILRDGQPFMSVGASGGPTIITGTLFAMLDIIDFGRPPTQAVTATRVHHQWLPDTLFIEVDDPELIEGLGQRGHTVTVRRAYNSVQLVVRAADGRFVGVSDPRKHGTPAAPATTPEEVDPSKQVPVVVP